MVHGGELMGFIDSSDVKKLLQDPEFKSDIAKAMRT